MKSHTVLYVEDNAVNIYLVQAIFSGRAHFHLLTATNGKSGLDMAQQHRPDLILLDLNLPDMDGEEFLTKLRAIESIASTPVIVVSADALDEQRAQCLNLKVTDYVTKPFDIGQFQRIVDRHLNAGN